MKLIFSRKGFDSSFGGVASPILPDGRMLSLPIPALHGVHGWEDVDAPGIDVAQLVADLRGPGRLPIPAIHLDPDLRRAVQRQPLGWRPALGQVDAANGHLKRHHVGAGDLFLFFGWFREVEHRNGRWRFVPKAEGIHALFGWLEVGAVVELPWAPDTPDQLKAAIADHAHVVRKRTGKLPSSESIYIAAERSQWAGTAAFGGGAFEHFDRSLRLTAPGEKRSIWSLPADFAPEGRPALSYHGRPDRWSRAGERVLLSTVAKGQEFVLDTAHYPDAAYWAAMMIEKNAVSGAEA